jgi:hypothetical protein
VRREAVAVGGDARRDLLCLEHFIDGAEHALAGTERMLELAEQKIQSGVLVRAFEIAPHLRELLGRRVLKGEDRLLLVADGEDRAPELAGALAGGEFGDEALDDLPLLGARVLRLVDQQVVDAEVQLVVHPGRVDAFEQRQRLVDQVVVVDETAPLLFVVVARQHRRSDGEQRRAAVAADNGIAPSEDAMDARPLGAQLFDQRGILDRPRSDSLARGSLIGAENLEVGFDPFRARQCGEHAEPPGLVAVVLAPLRQGRGNGAPLRRRDQGACEELGLDAVDRVVRRDAERAGKSGDCLVNPAGAHEPGADRVAPADRFAHQVAKRLVGAGSHCGAERAAERAIGRGSTFEQHGQCQLFQKLHLRRLVEHVEVGGDVRFEGKLVQELGAEGVDGMHLEAARRLQRAGKKPPRQGPLRAGQRSAKRQTGSVENGGIEGGIVERGPVRERVEHALRHIRGRCLGEGDAEDLLWLDAGEQQVDHALRQHVRLARSGIGGDPRGNGGIRHGGLHAPHVGGNDVRRSHGITISSSGPPVADHSLTRAKWS